MVMATNKIVGNQALDANPKVNMANPLHLQKVTVLLPFYAESVGSNFFFSKTTMEGPLPSNQGIPTYKTGNYDNPSVRITV